MIDALIPKGVCWHCDEAQADQNFWICKGCWVSVRRVGLKRRYHKQPYFIGMRALETLLNEQSSRLSQRYIPCCSTPIFRCLEICLYPCSTALASSYSAELPNDMHR